MFTATESHIKLCNDQNGYLELYTVYEKKADWETGRYMGTQETLRGQWDAGTTYGGKDAFPY